MKIKTLLGAALALMLAFPTHFMAENNPIESSPLESKETIPQEKINQDNDFNQETLVEKEKEVGTGEQIDNEVEEALTTSNDEGKSPDQNKEQQNSDLPEQDHANIINKTTTNTIDSKNHSLQNENESIEKLQIQTFSTTQYVQDSSTSKLGRIQSVNAGIYRNISDKSPYRTAGAEYTDKVFYIKRQAELNGQLYYLISTVASSTNGVIGWVRAGDMWAQNHVGVDKQAKTFAIKGTGWAYTDAWGAGKDVIYRDLSPFKNQTFKVNLTEKVGNYIWYRGVLNGRLVWVQAGNVTLLKESSIKEISISKLGRIQKTNAGIYKNVDDLSPFRTAGTEYTEKVLYIKKQAEFNGQQYYLISTVASSTKGVIGWVKVGDMWAQNHVGVDKQAKTFILKGTGWAYTDAWGAVKDIVYSDLTPYKNQVFNVNLTEKVGNYIWYRGELSGKTVWVQAGNVASIIETSTSKLGRIQNKDAGIYKNIGDSKPRILAGTEYTDKVFYIKKQGEVNGQKYYLISTAASSTKGIIGWVKAYDIWTQNHVGVNKQAKTFILKGTGWAYTDAWGAGKDVVYSDLSPYKNQNFKVNLTEKVGNYVWYRGELNGRWVWIQAGNVTTIKESVTSKLGRIQNANAGIYNNIGDKGPFRTAGTEYTDKVFYIKKQAEVNGRQYYLISTVASSTSGVLGWVNADDMWAQSHVGIDRQSKTFLLKGTGRAYTDAWGAGKDVVYRDLTPYKNQAFKVNLTEKVGNYIWYRGELNGRWVWIQASNINNSNMIYTNYNLTLSQALDIQMTRSPQTDKYRKNNAFIPSTSVDIKKGAVISGDPVNLRTAPTFGQNVNVTVKRGTVVEYIGQVTGDLYAGSKIWYKITYDGKTLYVHSSLANVQGEIAITNTVVKLYEEAKTNSHVYGTLSKGTNVSIVEKQSGWIRINYNETWRNAKRTDVAEFLDPSRNDIFQHLLLTTSSGVSAAELDKVLVGKGILQGKGKDFIDAGKKHSVNEIYLISHALLETGHGTSPLATGIEVGKDKNGTSVVVTEKNRNNLSEIKKVYNMFGIGAFDSCPETCGATYAYNSKWFTPKDAIVGGAQFVSSSYFARGQNTLYKMRWNHAYPNVNGEFPQYATDVGWAVKQIAQFKNLYSKLTNPTVMYDVPRYK